MDDAKTPADARTAKRVLREQIREVWDHADLDAVGRSVVEHLLAMPEVRGAGTIAVYTAMHGEVPTDALIAELDRRGIRVLLPVLRDDCSLDWRLSAVDAELQPGRRGTSEPAADSPEVPLSAADVVVVPGLAYDGAGRRLGRGGGSYDRALREVSSQAVVVGVAPEEAVVDEVPTERHDRRVHVVVTPRGARRTGDGGC